MSQKQRTDTERLDFLIRHAYYGSVAVELKEGRSTMVRLEREFIDNAMSRLESNIADGKYAVPEKVGTQPVDRVPE